ncbi:MULTISPECIES: antibiotic biosynthesis monooxygenase [unclassified Streptomyces]|uniref:antibiotic biosynthesis monooxygenase family protein n=1 Tax=unclassified Streptomyces TaxID=2593676 RepID=UPI001655944E|nr:antibiotic biosynthesis monooxygenase [Streptomyces sp. CB02980]MCB8902634.1 antibiotic biosynthesis monooxygenase [Streptomyces sp. CB02980]
MTPKLVADLEPPYYTAVFTSIRPEALEGYAETAVRMREIVGELPGFLGYETARTPGGIGISIAYFRDLEALDAWRLQTEHQAAKAYGREHWYDSYSVHIGKVERSYSFERE